MLPPPRPTQTARRDGKRSASPDCRIQPLTVINDVLGVPPEARDWLGAALDTLSLGIARQHDSDRTPVQAANDAAEQMLSYFAGLLDQRATPADDLMDRPGHPARRRGGLPGPACELHFLRARRAPDHTTLPTLGTQLLCTHRAALAALHDDPGRRPAAVEEMLRLITPTTFTGATSPTDRHPRRQIFWNLARLVGPQHYDVSPQTPGVWHVVLRVRRQIGR